MYFLDWCSTVIGIQQITQGKIVKQVLIPSFPGVPIRNNVELCKLDAVVINGGEILIASHNEYLRYLENLKAIFKAISPNDDPVDFELFKFDHFNSEGLDISRIEFSQKRPLHLHFENDAYIKTFFQIFPQYIQIVNTNNILGKRAVEITPNIIANLYNLYYKSGQAKISQHTDLIEIKMHRDRLITLLLEIESPYVSKGLKATKKLSLDNDNDYDIYNEEACTAFSVSLRVYAQLNFDNLHPDDYALLNHMSALIESFNSTNTSLIQCLKTDAIFTRLLVDKFDDLNEDEKMQSADGALKCKHELQSSSQEVIANIINENANNMLYGHPSAPLESSSFKMLRFLPDNNMQSETDQMIFQGGGRRYHSSIFRIIKVAMQDDERVVCPLISSYFKYYKIESNLGAGCFDINPQEGTCSATHVTEIIPFVFDQDGTCRPSGTDPLIDSEKYQREMNETIFELIKVERELLLYREAVAVPATSTTSVDSVEGKEWLRLNERKLWLSGVVCHSPIVYISKDSKEGSHPIIVQTDKDYLQQRGSCIAFSLKELFISMIGPTLGSLVNNLIQLHDGFSYVQSLKIRLNALNKQIASLEPLEISIPRQNLIQWLQTFRQFLNLTDSVIPGLSIKTHNVDEPHVIIQITNSIVKWKYQVFQKMFPPAIYSQNSLLPLFSTRTNENKCETKDEHQSNYKYGS